DLNGVLVHFQRNDDILPGDRLGDEFDHVPRDFQRFQVDEFVTVLGRLHRRQVGGRNVSESGERILNVDPQARGEVFGLVELVFADGPFANELTQVVLSHANLILRNRCGTAAENGGEREVAITG